MSAIPSAREFRDLRPRFTLWRAIRSPGFMRLVARCAVTGVCIAAVAVFATLLLPASPEPELYTLQQRPFRVAVDASGILEPLNTVRVRSECEWTTRILSLVPEGTFVRKGDVVCVLDSSEIEEFLRSREVYLIKTRAAQAGAKQKEELQKSANERRLAEARNELSRAELDLLEYSEGTFPAEVEELDKQIAFASDRVTMAEDDLAFSERMWSLGLSARASVDTAALKSTVESESLRNLRGQKHLLEQFSHPRRSRELSYRVDHSRLSVARTELANALADARARIETLSEERRRDIYERYAETARRSIEACTLKAPRDGQVIYANNWYLKSRGVTSIEEGKSVYFSQPVFEIPDSHHLKMAVPLSETLITRVTEGMKITVRPVSNDTLEVPARLAGISAYPVARNYYAPQNKDYILDVVLEPGPEQQPLLSARMDATASVPLFEKPDALTVPEEAVTRHAGKTIVLLSQGTALLPCPIEAGDVVDGEVLVESGLQPGDQVVAAITDEQTETLSRLSSGSEGD